MKANAKSSNIENEEEGNFTNYEERRKAADAESKKMEEDTLGLDGDQRRSNYEKRKLTEAIPNAFENYKMMRELKINKPEKKKSFSDYSDLADDMRDQVLRGRELNGEPRNFDF